MTWQDGVAIFFGGVFLANFTPHFIAGVSGRAFHSPGSGSHPEHGAELMS